MAFQVLSVFYDTTLIKKKSPRQAHQHAYREVHQSGLNIGGEQQSEQSQHDVHHQTRQRQGSAEQEQQEGTDAFQKFHTLHLQSYEVINHNKLLVDFHNVSYNIM